VLVRTWNLFHGNTDPPQRRAFLAEMRRLAIADDPDVLCVQEVPAWALGRFSVGDVAARPRLGPLPIPALAGRALTELNHGFLRSAFAGQGNAIQLSARLRLLDHHVVELNPRSFRAVQAAALGLGRRIRLAWGRERRIAQVVRVQLADGRAATVANLHCTSSPDDRLPDLELRRAAQLIVPAAPPGDIAILAGDFNVLPERSRTLAELAGPAWGFSRPGAGIDHILVRGAAAGVPIRWPERLRQRGHVLLSDHAPVDVEIS
jgi:endonuclease/exonuclease/phosphatase family metal-dependent hydrolase